MKLTSIELISACPDPVIIVDNRGVINVFNPAAERLLGFKAENVINSLKLAEVYEREGEGDKIKQLLATDTYGEIGQIQRYRTHIVGYSGQIYPVRVSAAVLHEGDKAVGIISYFHDLTSSEQLEAELQDLSRTDQLTGLFNARQLNLSLQDEISRSTRYKHPFSLICFSQLGLKDINAQLGHLIGDSVLKLLALVTRDTLRENDTGYRLTGNEFFVICPETDYTGARRVAERLQATFSELLPQALGVSYNELNAPLSLGQGISVFYGGNQVDRDELIQQAVQTKDKAKLNGEDLIHHFEATMRPDQ